MSKFDEAIYILIVDLISKKERFGSKSVNLEEITETVKDNIRTSLNKLYLQQLTNGRRPMPTLWEWLTACLLHDEPASYVKWQG